MTRRIDVQGWSTVCKHMFFVCVRRTSPPVCKHLFFVCVCRISPPVCTHLFFLCVLNACAGAVLSASIVLFIHCILNAMCRSGFQWSHSFCSVASWTHAQECFTLPVQSSFFQCQCMRRNILSCLCCRPFLNVSALLALNFGILTAPTKSQAFPLTPVALHRNNCFVLAAF